MLWRTALALIVSSSFCNGWAESLDRATAEKEAQRLWRERRGVLQAERAGEVKSNVFTLDGKTMRWMEKVYGDTPAYGHSLWISLHGGGNAPSGVNDDQWTNQLSLYRPAEGIYVAPRAPTDTWNLWHERHIDPMLDRLIEDYVAVRGVNPDRVYLMGYSAGGDGVWQLAPRMADRWAAAAMMAGHPNDASVISLRNLPFGLFVGADDSSYDKNKVIPERAKELDALQAGDSQGYIHLLRVYPGVGHWMDLKDAEALPWMMKYTRQPWPKRIVWLQASVPHTRFYWLSIPKDEARTGKKIIGAVDGQTIRLTGDVPNNTRVRLSDYLLNLNEPVRVLVNDREVFKGVAARSVDAIRESLQERADPRTAATAIITLTL